MPRMHEGFAPLQPPNTNPVRWRRLRRLTGGVWFGRGGYAAGYREEGVEKGVKGLARPGAAGLQCPVRRPSQAIQVALGIRCGESAVRWGGGLRNGSCFWGINPVAKEQAENSDAEY
jgi:hypothetical protein